MIRRILLVALALVVVHALLSAAGAGGLGVVALMVFWWVLAGYVAWRAWPAVSADVRRLLDRYHLSARRRRDKGLETF